ncbi:MAG TPA: NapC/NirT family cytochrome c [Coriobacteriia bacterium]|nr:NapC/NirT family cytochrome c [Coriobacteriia bacterium]
MSARRRVGLAKKREQRSTKGLVVWGVIGVVAVCLLFAVTAIATDRPDFCPSCHEMKPHYDAWKTGPHKDVWCIDCHVAPGVPARFTHKFVALGEVWSHVTGAYAFPQLQPASVPDNRCVTCHSTVAPKDMPKAFDHAMHAKTSPCQQCHENTGHEVGDQALQAAGVLDAHNAQVRAEAGASGAAVAVPGQGVANLQGHKAVACTQCHDMAKTGCKACHRAPTSKHQFSGDCATCHQPGETFAFAHPTSGDCSQCHKAPGGKHPSDKNCVACHSKSGSSWAFTHRGNTGEHKYTSFACTKCHPGSYEKASCTCHKNGVPRD